MRPAYKRIMVGGALLALGMGMVLLHYGARLASIGTSYAVKTLCSGIFVSHRDLQSLLWCLIWGRKSFLTKPRRMRDPGIRERSYADRRRESP